jgi:hypothetical protein
MTFQTKMLSCQNSSPFSIGTQPKSRKNWCHWQHHRAGFLVLWLFFISDTPYNISCLQHAKNYCFKRNKHTVCIYFHLLHCVDTCSPKTGYGPQCGCELLCALRRTVPLTTSCWQRPEIQRTQQLIQATVWQKIKWNQIGGHDMTVFVLNTHCIWAKLTQPDFVHFRRVFD